MGIRRVVRNVVDAIGDARHGIEHRVGRDVALLKGGCLAALLFGLFLTAERLRGTGKWRLPVRYLSGSSLTRGVAEPVTV
jgi:hypothetical protein